MRARNDASTTRFAFLSESRIVELGTPKMAYEQTVAVVDYYQELNLDKDDATPDIQVQLNKIRMQWRQRASLNGSRGEEARAKLKMIENASNVFSNEDSRDASTALCGHCLKWLSRISTGSAAPGRTTSPTTPERPALPHARHETSMPTIRTLT